MVHLARRILTCNQAKLLIFVWTFRWQANQVTELLYIAPTVAALVSPVPQAEKAGALERSIMIRWAKSLGI